MKQTNPLLYGVIGVIIGGALVWSVTTSAVNSSNSGMMSMMGIRGGSPRVLANSDSLDAHFIEQMIPHHQDAITMAKLAQTQAQKPEVKQLANNIISSQSKEIEQMKSWYKDWFGKSVPEDDDVMGGHGMMNGGSMHMGTMGNDSDLTTLENASNFDKTFVSEMIPHHQMAVMMATMLKNGTQRPEMKKLADDIISAQTKEINQMREWLTNW